MRPQFCLAPVLLILLGLFPLHGQKKGYEPGYVITRQGDTLVGQVKDRDPEPYTSLYPRIHFRADGKSSRKKFRAREILGYRAGQREYVSLPLKEESFFLTIRYVLDPAAEPIFLQVIRRDGPLAWYHREFIHDDSFYLDFFPLFHRQGTSEMVRVTQGVLGLKRKRLMEYFGHCPSLVAALAGESLRNVEEVYNFYLEYCLEGTYSHSKR